MDCMEDFLMMRASKRRELYKLRELVHFLLVGKTCFFCHEPLSDKAELFTTHGNAVGPEFSDKISIHHIDENHHNNTHSNKAACHTKCHKAHHRRLENTMRELRKKTPVEDRDV